MIRRLRASAKRTGRFLRLSYNAFMAMIELPHTAGCLVCGPANPHGLHLSLFVDEGSGEVRIDFVPRPQDIGFEGIVHGGVLATVLDEAMVWAAIWKGKRMYVAGEMIVRFRQSARVGEALVCRTRVESFRSRLVQTAGEIVNAQGEAVAQATGKYAPVAEEHTRRFIDSLLDQPGTAAAVQALRHAQRKQEG